MRSEGNAALARTNEVDHFSDLRGERARCDHTFDRQLEILARPEQRDERVAQHGDGRCFEARAAETYHVDGAQRMRTIDDAERRDVAAHAATAASQGQAADARVLMNHAIAGDERAITDLDPSRQQRTATDYDFVADSAVMRDMRVMHHEVVVADNRDLALFASAMNRGALAKDVAIANSHLTRRAAVGKVLRLVADDGGRMHHVVRAKLGLAEDRHVTDEAGARTDLDLSVQQAERADFGARTQLDSGPDHRGRMNARRDGFRRHR